MTQQLRLVEPITPIEPAGRRRKHASPAPRARTARAASPRGRRAASWGEWQLDPRTRRVGKAGIAAARQALEAAAAHAHVVENHRQAS